MTARPQDVALLPLPEEDGDLPRSGAEIVLILGPGKTAADITDDEVRSVLSAMTTTPPEAPGHD